MMTQLPIRNIYVVWLNVCSSWKHNMSWTSETWNLYVWITCITWASINRELNHGGRINHNGWKNSPNWWLDQTGSIGRISILPLFLFFLLDVSGCFFLFFFETNSWRFGRLSKAKRLLIPGTVLGKRPMCPCSSIGYWGLEVLLLQPFGPPCLLLMLDCCLPN